MIKILLADDHAIVREGLKQIVAEESDMLTPGEAGDAAEMFKLLKTNSWDIVVLDINMPEKSGLEALKDLRVEFPQLPVLVLRGTVRFAIHKSRGVRLSKKSKRSGRISNGNTQDCKWREIHQSGSGRTDGLQSER